MSVLVKLVGGPCEGTLMVTDGALGLIDVCRPVPPQPDIDVEDDPVCYLTGRYLIRPESPVQPHIVGTPSGMARLYDWDGWHQ